MRNQRRVVLFNNRRMGGISLLALLWLVLFSAPATAQTESTSGLTRYEFVQIRMGVPARITVYAADEALAIQASDSAYERLKQLDRCLSDYDPDSELNQFCRKPCGTEVAVSPDLWTMLDESQHYARSSQGALDITVGPIVKLWRVSRRSKKLPDPEKLKTALAAVGYENLQLNEAKKSAKLLKPNMQLDFGAIAKGYAADEAYAVLAKHGLTIAMVAVAGDIRVGDPPPGQSGWRIAVEERGANGPEEHHSIIVELCREGISTAGDTYQYLELDGVRYSHIVDPKTGVGLTRPGSATVIAPTCTESDALDTLIFVLGREAGLEYLKQYPQAVGLFVELNQEGRPVQTPSPGWERRFPVAK